MSKLEIKTKPELCQGSGGLAGAISWERLEEQLRSAGELRNGETIIRVEVDENGITYFIHRYRRDEM